MYNCISVFVWLGVDLQQLISSTYVGNWNSKLSSQQAVDKLGWSNKCMHIEN